MKTCNYGNPVWVRKKKPGCSPLPPLLNHVKMPRASDRVSTTRTYTYTKPSECVWVYRRLEPRRHTQACSYETVLPVTLIPYLGMRPYIWENA